MNKFKIFLTSLVLLFGTSSLISQTYEQDAGEVDFYVPGILANDAMQSVNFLLCFIEKTNFQTFIDKGVYKALTKLNVNQQMEQMLLLNKLLQRVPLHSQPVLAVMLKLTIQNILQQFFKTLPITTP